MSIAARDVLGRITWQGGKQDTTCPACGQGFELYPSDIKRGRRFCSTPCSNAAGTPRPGAQRRVEKICEVCDTHFEVWLSDAEGRRFCGNRCKGVAMTIRPQIQAFYASAAWRAARIQVWERDGYRCVKCAETDRLVAHHLDEIRKTTPDQWLNVDRIITLCIPDHNLTHGRFTGAV